MTLFVLASNSSYFLWWGAQVVAVAILIALVLRWRPKFMGGRTIGETLGGALDARENQIREQLAAAERSRQEAAKIQEQSRQDIERAKSEAAEIVARAEHTSHAIQEEMVRRAEEEYQRILAQASEEIDYERRQAELALRRRAADIVVDAASQVVRQNLSPEIDRRIVDDSLTHLGNGR